MSQSGEKDWDEGFACLAAYNKSLTSAGRSFSCFPVAQPESCFTEVNALRKVFIDRGGVEILCSLLKPSTRVIPPR